VLPSIFVDITTPENAQFIAAALLAATTPVGEFTSTTTSSDATSARPQLPWVFAGLGVVLVAVVAGAL
jgi:hypothetical protein